MCEEIGVFGFELCNDWICCVCARENERCNLRQKECNVGFVCVLLWRCTGICIAGVPRRGSKYAEEYLSWFIHVESEDL